MLKFILCIGGLTFLYSCCNKLGNNGSDIVINNQYSDKIPVLSIDEEYLLDKGKLYKIDSLNRILLTDSLNSFSYKGVKYSVNKNIKYKILNGQINFIENDDFCLSNGIIQYKTPDIIVDSLPFSSEIVVKGFPNYLGQSFSEIYTIEKVNTPEYLSILNQTDILVFFSDDEVKKNMDLDRLNYKKEQNKYPNIIFFGKMNYKKALNLENNFIYTGFALNVTSYRIY